MVYDNGLEQLVKEPTMEENTLDLFLTNCPQLEVVPGISDLSIRYCEISTSARRKKQTQRQIPLYNKTDWDSLRTVAIERSADLQRMDGVATTEEPSETLFLQWSSSSLTRQHDQNLASPGLPQASGSSSTGVTELTAR